MSSLTGRSPFDISPDEAISKCRWALTGVGIASALINILYLTGSFFMLEVYDRVIPSKSIPTLIGLSILALTLYCFQGLFETLRSRMLVRIAATLDATLSARVFRTMLKLPIRTKTNGDGMQPLRDFDQVRTFLSGMGPSALFDLPWLPFYLAICFALHPIIGWITVGGGVILAFITLLTNTTTRKYSKLASESGNERSGYMLHGLRNAEVIQALGLSDRMTQEWTRKSNTHRHHLTAAADLGNGFVAASKIFRMALQSAVLATGAVLVIYGEASAGIMIASSILTSRALAPLEQAIANWRGLVGARQSWNRLVELLNAFPEAAIALQLPAPRRSLAVSELAATAPGSERVIFSGVSFFLEAGNAMGIIGASASGKSSLGRALLGVWPTVRGTVRLDGAAINQWNPSELGSHIGYLPQDVELFGGTIAENISRFANDATAESIIAAAKAARVHDLIVNLPNGYETQIGNGGIMLSAGQRQRVALARALYGNPFLIILDEPNSNLDTDGEQALADAITDVRARGGIVIVIAHRPSVLASVDHMLVLNSGRVEAFGLKDEVFGRVLRKPERHAQLAVVAENLKAAAQ